QARVAGDAIEPGREGRIALEALEPPIRRKEGVLRAVGCVLLVAQDSVGQSIDAVTVATDELVEGAGVAGLSEAHELVIGAIGMRAATGDARAPRMRACHADLLLANVFEGIEHPCPVLWSARIPSPGSWAVGCRVVDRSLPRGPGALDP